MGYVPVEQTVAIIEAVGEATRVAPPVEPKPNYWWLLAIAIIPVIIGAWLTRGKK